MEMNFNFLLTIGKEHQVFTHKWKRTSIFYSQMEKNIKLLLLLDEISFLNLTIIIFQFLDASYKIQMK